MVVISHSLEHALSVLGLHKLFTHALRYAKTEEEANTSISWIKEIAKDFALRQEQKGASPLDLEAAMLEIETLKLI
jgi:hypothetical protein